MKIDNEEEEDIESEGLIKKKKKKNKQTPNNINVNLNILNNKKNFHRKNANIGRRKKNSITSLESSLKNNNNYFTDPYTKVCMDTNYDKNQNMIKKKNKKVLGDNKIVNVNIRGDKTTLIGEENNNNLDMIDSNKNVRKIKIKTTINRPEERSVPCISYRNNNYQLKIGWWNLGKKFKLFSNIEKCKENIKEKYYKNRNNCKNISSTISTNKYFNKFLPNEYLYTPATNTNHFRSKNSLNIKTDPVSDFHKLNLRPITGFLQSYKKEKDRINKSNPRAIIKVSKYPYMQDGYQNTLNNNKIFDKSRERKDGLSIGKANVLISDKKNSNLDDTFGFFAKISKNDKQMEDRPKNRVPQSKTKRVQIKLRRDGLNNEEKNNNRKKKKNKLKKCKNIKNQSIIIKHNKRNSSDASDHFQNIEHVRIKAKNLNGSNKRINRHIEMVENSVSPYESNVSSDESSVKTKSEEFYKSPKIEQENIFEEDIAKSEESSMSHLYKSNESFTSSFPKSMSSYEKKPYEIRKKNKYNKKQIAPNFNIKIKSNARKNKKKKKKYSYTKYSGNISSIVSNYSNSIEESGYASSVYRHESESKEIKYYKKYNNKKQNNSCECNSNNYAKKISHLNNTNVKNKIKICRYKNDKKNYNNTQSDFCVSSENRLMQNSKELNYNKHLDQNLKNNTNEYSSENGTIYNEYTNSIGMNSKNNLRYCSFDEEQKNSENCNYQNFQNFQNYDINRNFQINDANKNIKRCDAFQLEKEYDDYFCKS
ncbi:conserved Plasmodium protein, unknown function [Plasmodium vinckei brucechwatti]|uniref:Uncharacterized protein n=1 Tax=Plasmodium vinckei brucechwatti TaxID=119398 RepID=A0A6V7S6Z7_PLAVN|nr:conserved Plasmodium protein, unknown function [Plasmodium vinckei brucechwatti]